MGTSSCTARGHLSKSRIQGRGQHLAPRYQRKRPSPGPIASFLRHCNAMESLPIPSYLNGGPQPADDIQHLNREASMENLALRNHMCSSMVQWHTGSDYGRDSKGPDMDLSSDWRVESLASSAANMGPAIASKGAPTTSTFHCSISTSSTNAGSIGIVQLSSKHSNEAPTSKNPFMASAPRSAPFPNTPEADPWATRQPRSQ